jgi:polyribonucleotide nucleotidyltransferase
MVVNPTFSEMVKSDIDLIVAGTKKAVTMIEGSSKNVSEDDMINAVKLAHESIIKICESQEELCRLVNKEPFVYEPFTNDKELEKEIRARYFGELEALNALTKKMKRQDAIHAIIARAKKELAEQFPDTVGQCGTIIDSLDGEIVRRRILDEGKRADGRGLKDIRPIDIMLGILPRTHGSAVFTRGETQSLGVTTLGSIRDAQRVDNIEGGSEKNFMLHYHFPPFSVGETGRTGGVGRREIGHGMLAERALEYAIPDMSDFPYTIRQVSEVLESNGSSSMATVCSGSLSLFNAGVPMKAAVAGIAMGLVMEGDRYAVLSDILGLEDHLGDMDFKVAGTPDGITAFQMDIKIEGITPEIMAAALVQAREGRLSILKTMSSAISKPEGQLSQYAPKISVINIDPSRIGEVIGQGGRIIKRIIEETGADINIEDDGSITISAVGDDSINAAIDFINRIVKDLEVGAFYEGTVVKIMEFGAFVEIAPGKDGLVHISKLDHHRVNKVTDVVKVGDKVRVKVIKIDNNGRIDLSRKDALE